MLTIHEAQRSTVLIDTILWGNSHFDAKVGLAVSTNGKAYAVKNLQYAAALLEAHAEGREVQVRDVESRAERILQTLLRDVRTGAEGRAGGLHLPRWVGDDAPTLPMLVVVDQVLPVLAFLVARGDVLNITRESQQAIDRAAVLALLHAERSPAEKEKRGRARPDETDFEFLDRFRRAVPRQFHWAYSVRTDSDWRYPFEDVLPEWDLPSFFCEPLTPPAECKSKVCFVPKRDLATNAPIAGHVKAWFYRGDYDITAPPVIFVSGWQLQLLQKPDFGAIVDALKNAMDISVERVLELFGVLFGEAAEVFDGTHPSGYGFGKEAQFSTKPPAGGMPEGPMPVPPIVPLFLPGWSPYKNFWGLSTHLKCSAGYPHVRFQIAQPMDEIDLAVDELQAVVEATKEMYGTDKVILVCHSRGGLIARKYILQKWRKRKMIDVQKLITYGSPHQGAHLAELGEEIIASPLLFPSALVPTNLFMNDMLDMIALIPGVGADIKDAIQEAVVKLLVEIADPIWHELAVFLAAGSEFKPTGPFMTELNQGYAVEDVPLGPTPAMATQQPPGEPQWKTSLWGAIDHVLIAGTTPTLYTVYVGSYLPDLTPAGALDAIAPDVCWKTVKVGPLKTKVPYACFKWKWKWRPAFRLFQDNLKGTPIENEPAFKHNQGDILVEIPSALAQGTEGRIRRAKFALQHFALKTNDEQKTTYQSPIGERTVTPAELLLLELGIELPGELTACESESCG